MPWKDLPSLQKALARALSIYDWKGVDQQCEDLVGRLRAARAKFPLESASQILGDLRRKRRFVAMLRVAEALTESGAEAPRIGILYAQALIERGFLAPAEALLRDLSRDARLSAFEKLEIKGLLGRVGKQRYVLNGDHGARSRKDLESAIGEYLSAYRASPARNWWHGINAAALIARGRRDGVALSRAPNPAKLASDMLSVLLRKRKPEPWELATILECHVALGEAKSANDAALRYASSGADAFELGSTLRQVGEVWGLTEDGPPGNGVLPVLRAALLQREGGRIGMTPAQVEAEIENTGVLEKNFGSERLKTYLWYQAGLESCRAIARIETKTGRGYGTGWLIKASDFFPSRGAGEVLLITNAHVISPDYPDALRPDKAQANFMVSKTVSGIGPIVFTSPPSELDATIVELGSPPAVRPLPLSSADVRMSPRGQLEPRLYIIGHPSGRDLEFSLQDNVMLGCEPPRLHYRTPTEPGSSGSPVFDEDDWEVTALHHKGSARMQRLGGGEGLYEANEGILIRSIQAATARGA